MRAHGRNDLLFQPFTFSFFLHLSPLFAEAQGKTSDAAAKEATIRKLEAEIAAQDAAHKRVREKQAADEAAWEAKIKTARDPSDITVSACPAT